MSDNVFAPDAFVFACDNGGVDADGTLDRYTIQLEMSDGQPVLIASNAVASIWSSSEDRLIQDELSDSDIEWEQLPDSLKRILHLYIASVHL